MEKKFKIPVCIAVVLFIVDTASAQLKGFSIGPYIEAAKPHGDFQAVNGNGIGVGIGADVKLVGKLAAMGSIGYLHFVRKTGIGYEHTSPVNAIPIRAGLKYKLPLVYLKLESGTARISNGKQQALIISPGLGIRILGLDIQGSYETWLKEEGWSFASLKVAYHF